MTELIFKKEKKKKERAKGNLVCQSRICAICRHTDAKGTSSAV